MWRSVSAETHGAGTWNVRAGSPRCWPGGPGRRYRVFFVLPDQVDGRCEIGQDAPISIADVDAIERALMDRLGCSNALVIGWQELGGRGVPLPAAHERT